MFLSRIEVFGFKSFPQKLVMELGPGITSVVGPNGCGKSNIADAVRWALGEHNVRLLRGRLLEDLIFNGSQQREPLGMAEVTLTFSDATQDMGLGLEEVSITRRVFRSGESEFLLNGIPCRLKEIKDQFLDRGLGHRGYAIIEREMVDRVLEETSRERRALLEEAAGIARYKAREKAARRKLELTDIDLRRLEDIVGEVERRVDSLRRQLGKARRYQELERELKSVESRRLRSEFSSLVGRAESLVAERKELELKRESHRVALSTAEARRETVRLQREEADRALARAEAELGSASREAAQLDGKIRVLRERQRALQDRVTRAEEDTSSYASRREELLHRWEEGLAEEGRLKEKLAEDTRGREKTQCELEELERQHTERAALLEERRGKGLAALEERVSRSQELQAARRDLGSLESQVREVERQLEELGAESGRHGEELRARGEARQKLSRALEEAETERGRLRARLDELGEAKSRREERERELTAELSGIESSLSLLRELQERLEGFSHSVREIMQEARAGTPAAVGVKGVVGELLTSGQVKASRALEAALSQSLECVVTEDMSSARRMVSYLREARRGRATFLPLECLNGKMPIGSDAGPEGCPSSVRKESGVVGEALDFVDCEKRLLPVARFLLGQTVVTDSMEAAERLARQPAYSRLRFVTLAGESFLSPGIVTGGSPPDGERSPFDRGRRIDEMGERLARVRTQMEEAAELREQVTRELEAFGRRLEELEIEMEALREREQEERGELRRLEGVLSGAATRQNLLEEESARLADEMGRMRRLVSELEVDHLRLQEAGNVAVGELAELEEQVRGLEAGRDEARSRLHHVELELARCQSRLGNLTEELPRLVAEGEECGRNEQREREAAEEARRLGREVAEETTAEEESLEALSRELEVRRAGRDTAQVHAEELAGEERGIEQELTQNRTESAAAAEALHRLELTEREVRVEAENLRRRVREELGFDPGESGEGETDPPADPEESPESATTTLESLRERAGELQEKIRRLGPVNFVALEEYETEKDRLDFLTGQRDDLTRARGSLDEAIQQINLTARQRFVETFAEVRVHFQDTFRLLFEGGEADIYLSSGMDPLECPIEIVARPGGKSLREVSLLSGGERALTAIALLVALYRVKPSPFCILDEVDAPLDDANILRFTSMLGHLKDRTQFMVVTHNKRTMEAADTLYGVTMDEPGATSVVSVRLEEAVRWAAEKEDEEMVAELTSAR